MKKSEVGQIIEESALQFLEADAYKFANRGAGGAAFISKRIKEEYLLFYNISDYYPEFWIRFSCALRIIPIEEIWRQFADLLNFPPKVAKSSYTLGASQGDFKGDINYRIQNLHSPEDVQQAMLEVEEVYHTLFKPLMDRFHSVEEFDRTVNTNPEERFFYVPEGDGHRIFRSIIAARLSQNPRYDELKAFYRQRLVTREDLTKAFDHITAYLENL